ncbi:MAG: hypothetical protein ILO36_09450, partial [Abditibacteriota bacterium]|nr:hypothetical protein [Abditibacteriota bacterium]
LDGSVPMDEMLPLLDGYFGTYGRRDKNPGFAIQEPKGSERTIRYELGQEEEPENKGYLTLARITGTWKPNCKKQKRKGRRYSAKRRPRWTGSSSRGISGRRSSRGQSTCGAYTTK